MGSRFPDFCLVVAAASTIWAISAP